MRSLLKFVCAVNFRLKRVMSPASGISLNPGRASLFRNILRGTSLYLLAVIVMRITSLLLLPVSTRYITPAEYGVLDLVDQVGMVLALLLGGGLGSAFSFFYFREEAPEARRRVVGTALAGSLLIGLISGFLGWILAERISIAVFGSPGYALYMRLLFYGMPLSFLLEAVFAWLRTEDKAGVFLLATVARTILVATGTIVLLAKVHLGMIGVLYTTLGSVTVLAIGMTAYCLKVARPTFSASLFLRIMRYSLPLGVGGIAVFVVHFGDRFFLPHYRPLSELGIYGIAYKIAMLISFVYSSFHTYWSAQIFGIVRRDDGEEVVRRIFTYLALTIAFCALGLLVVVKPALRVLTTEAFQGAARIVPLILLAYVVRAISDFFRCFFLVAGRPGADALCNWIGAAVCLGGYFLFIPSYGMWGAATATVLSFLAISVISITWTYRLHPFSIEKKRLLKILVCLGFAVGAYYTVPVDSFALQIVWGMALLGSFPLLLWLLDFSTQAERAMAAAAIGRPARVLRSLVVARSPLG